MTAVAVPAPFDPTPYQTDRYQANGREWLAWDCWGVCRAVYLAEAGIVLDSWDTNDSRDPARTAAAVAKEAARGIWLEVDRAALRPLDMLLFLESGRPTHCGVVIQAPDFLHAREGSGVHVASLAARSQFWARRLVAAYRHRDLA